MAVSEKLKNAVLKKDFPAIRDCLWSRITLDPNFTKGFPESWNYCLENGISENELYEVHDGRAMSDEISNDNFSTLCGELSTNFSRERLDKIKKIGRALYPPQTQNTSQTNVKQGSERHKTNGRTSPASESGDSGLLLAAGAGLLLGAVGGGLVAGLLFKHAVAGAAIGAAAGAGVGAGLGFAFSKK